MHATDRIGVENTKRQAMRFGSDKVKEEAHRLQRLPRVPSYPRFPAAFPPSLHRHSRQGHSQKNAFR
eukprot:1641913-Pyramimonas_sp.AAC.1